MPEKLSDLDAIEPEAFDMAVESSADPSATERTWAELTRRNPQLAVELLAEAKRYAAVGAGAEEAGAHMASVLFAALRAQRELDIAKDVVDGLGQPDLPPAA